MKSLIITTLLLTVSTASAYNLRGQGNSALLQQISMPLMEEKETRFYSRISNGQIASPGQFRYQVALRIRKSNGGRTRCGGSLISSHFVLTAAHCIIDARTVSVYLGTITFAESAVAFRIPRSKMIYHSEFNRTTLHHDIGLIRTPSVSLSDDIDTVELAPRGNPSYVDGTAVLAGWGITDNSKKRSRTLLFAIFTIIKHEDCTKHYGGEVIYDGKMCTAAPEKTEGCGGDSGGPLVLTSPHIQIGILSIGDVTGCANGYPNAYTRVDSYLDCIREHTNLPV